jgi:hypothetical protein
MHQNLYKKGIGEFTEDQYWSSTDYFPSTTGTPFYQLATSIDFLYGVTIYSDKERVKRVRAARTFNF